MKKIDISTWERKEHFELFQNMLRPQVSVTVELDVTEHFKWRRTVPVKPRFSASLYHAVATAVNGIKEFRYRIVDREVVLYDTIHTGFTYMPKDRLLHANCFAPYVADFEAYAAHCEVATAEADRAPTLFPLSGRGQEVIYLSMNPAVTFTALVNPWGDPWEDTVPRFVFGKIHERAGRSLLPMGIEALHSFVDGIHISQLLEQVGERLNSVCT